VIVGAFLGFWSSVVATLLTKRWEVRVQNRREIFFAYLPEARLAVGHPDDVEALRASDRLVRACLLAGDDEGRLARKMAELGGEWRYFRGQAHDERHAAAVRDDYAAKAVTASNQYNDVADALQESVAASIQRPTWLERLLLP
jgi:hypothetical protein